MEWSNSLFGGNEVLAGLVGASIIGGLMFMARSLPSNLLWILRRQLTVEVVVDNTSEAFPWVLEWLATTDYAATSRRLRVTDGPYRGEHEDDRWAVSPGEGIHWFAHGGRPVMVRHVVNREQARNRFIPETIEIATLGRDRSPLLAIIEEARDLRHRKQGVQVYAWTGGYWRRCGWKRGRDPETVVLADGIMDNLIRDARWFSGAGSWYAGRGIPYRRGYLFAGPPGTGKTSVIMALATVLERPVFVANIGGFSGDDDIMAAFGSVPSNAILAIEDVDVTAVGQARPGLRTRNPESPVAIPADEPEKSERQPITLSALLNAIDGITAADGRILIMTTNRPEVLDKALIRPGRADLTLDFQPLAMAAAERMAEVFGLASDGIDWGWDDWPRPAAEVQGVLMRSIQHFQHLEGGA